LTDFRDEADSILLENVRNPGSLIVGCLAKGEDRTRAAEIFFITEAVVCELP
jgi:hypothetical protein